MAPTRHDSTLSHIPIYTLAGICLLGSFSRLTHGEYNPWMYDYQEYHAKDDGSTTTKMIPLVDLVVAASILWKPTRLTAVVISIFFVATGLALQVAEGKHFGVDVMHVLLGLWSRYVCTFSNGKIHRV